MAIYGYECTTDRDYAPFPVIILNDDAVHILNSKIANASCNTIFGKNREDIKMYSKEFNQRKYLEFVGNLTD